MFVYALITPIILLLLLAEILYCHYAKKDFYNFKDAIANIGTTLGTQCINLGVAILVFIAYGWIYKNFSITQIEQNWWSWTIVLLAIDFLFYWFHRWGHKINILWAAHSPHHSSEEFNLSVGLRASFTQRLFSFTMFWPLCIIGFSPEMIYMGTGFHLLIGYWHHTRVIGKMGWFEKYFNTPSHHRVHHGVNTQYLDKNFAEILIIWDKIFGTFEEENEEVCYGITTPVNSYNPFTINLQYWRYLWNQAKAAPCFWDKIKLWFMPLGWMPRGLTYTENKEVGIGLTIDEQIKFRVRKTFDKSKLYLIVHSALGIGFLYLIINKNSLFTTLDKSFGIAIIFVMIYAWSLILHAKKMAKYIETFRLLAIGILLFIVNYKYNVVNYTSITFAIVLLIIGISIFWNFIFNTEKKIVMV